MDQPEKLIYWKNAEPLKNQSDANNWEIIKYFCFLYKFYVVYYTTNIKILKLVIKT